MYVEERTTEKV